MKVPVGAGLSACPVERAAATFSRETDGEYVTVTVAVEVPAVRVASLVTVRHRYDKLFAGSAYRVVSATLVDGSTCSSTAVRKSAGSPFSELVSGHTTCRLLMPVPRSRPPPLNAVPTMTTSPVVAIEPVPVYGAPLLMDELNKTRFIARSVKGSLSVFAPIVESVIRS